MCKLYFKNSIKLIFFFFFFLRPLGEDFFSHPYFRKQEYYFFGLSDLLSSFYGRFSIQRKLDFNATCVNLLIKFLPLSESCANNVVSSSLSRLYYIVVFFQGL